MLDKITQTVQSTIGESKQGIQEASKTSTSDNQPLFDYFKDSMNKLDKEGSLSDDEINQEIASAQDNISNFEQDYKLTDVEKDIRKRESEMNTFKDMIEKSENESDPDNNFTVERNDNFGYYKYTWTTEDGIEHTATKYDNENKLRRIYSYDYTGDDNKYYYDYDGDGIVDKAEISRFDGGTCTYGYYVDSNGDGKIDASDGGVVTKEKLIQTNDSPDLEDEIRYTTVDRDYNGTIDDQSITKGYEPSNNFEPEPQYSSKIPKEKDNNIIDWFLFLFKK